RAPMDGVVVAEPSLKHIVGNFVPQGATLCRVINDHQLKAKLSLPQQQIALVKAKMPVRIRLWANPSKVITAAVTGVNPMVDDTMADPRMGSQMGGDVEVTSGKDGETKAMGRRGTVVIESLTDP